MFLQRQKRLRIFIAGLHVYIRRRLPLFGSRRAFYCNVVLKIIPLLLLLSWPFLSFSNLSVRVPALSHSAFEPIFLDRFTRLEQNGHGAFGCRSLQVTGVICPHPQEAGPRCWFPLRTAVRTLKLPCPLIIPCTLAPSVRQEVFLSSDGGVLSSPSLVQPFLPPPIF